MPISMYALVYCLLSNKKNSLTFLPMFDRLHLLACIRHIQDSTNFIVYHIVTPQNINVTKTLKSRLKPMGCVYLAFCFNQKQPSFVSLA